MSENGNTDVKPKVKKHLTTDEAQALIAAAGKRGRYPDRDRVLLQLVYRHGLRAAEACDAVWDDFDLARGTFTVRRKKSGTTSTHTMDNDELRALRKLRKGTNGHHVFTTERGGPITVDVLQYIVMEAGKVAGFPFKAHPHMLRHAAGYSLINAGNDVRMVQVYLGHKNIASTAIYTEISPKLLAGVRVR
jgi:integrase